MDFDTSKARSKSKINHPTIDVVKVKVQSVKTVELESSNDGRSIGSAIDGLLSDCYVDGWYPNKISLEINPFPPEHPERMD